MNDETTIDAKSRELDAVHDQALQDALGESTLTLSQVGVLMGDDPRDVWPAPTCYRLCIAAKAGSIATVENANWIESKDVDGNVIARREREHYEFLHVTRASLAVWLSGHGTDVDRGSCAARWALTDLEASQ